MAREAAWFIIGLAGQAPHRRSRVTSNVRRHQKCLPHQASATPIMAIEFASAALGGAIGLLGGLGGIALGHMLTNRRETRSRNIAGLSEVVRELEKRRRLSLDIAQHVNTFAAVAKKEEGRSIFDQPGWKEAILALHERTWVFPCIAYLPEVKPKFERLDHLIDTILEWADTDVDEEAHNARITDIHHVAHEILVAAEQRLAKLV